jgi:hypothetical protein
MIVRAGSIDRDIVRALGINITPIFSLVFGLGAPSRRSPASRRPQSFSASGIAAPSANAR